MDLIVARLYMLGCPIRNWLCQCLLRYERTDQAGFNLDYLLKLILLSHLHSSVMVDVFFLYHETEKNML